LPSLPPSKPKHQHRADVGMLLANLIVTDLPPVGLCSKLSSSPDEWPVSPPHSRAKIQMPAAISVLRARAARNHYFRCGLFAVIRSIAAFWAGDCSAPGRDGPFLPFTDRSRCCGRSPLSGRSLLVRDLGLTEFTLSGQTGFVQLQLLLTQKRLAGAASYLLRRRRLPDCGHSKWLQNLTRNPTRPCMLSG
jgi:hypothetical protein